MNANVVSLLRSGQVREFRFPQRNAWVVPGVRWGDPSEVLSPAYWALRVWSADDPLDGFLTTPQQTLTEETAFCLLGGYGIRVEVAEAYYRILKDEGVLERPEVTEREIEQLLQRVVFVGGVRTRYRFPHQRARRIRNALQSLAELDPLVEDHRKLRDQLLEVDGIGPKTASWIVRNYLRSDAVAILDIHIIRACQIMGLFPYSIYLPREYSKLEELFVKFCNAIRVSPAELDAIMWSQMREFTPRTLRELTGQGVE